jgi:hypothetical protein
MPEFNSRAAALIAAGSKALNTTHGKKRTAVIVSPAVAAWAANDTLAGGILIPKGSRFCASNFVSSAAMGAGVLLSVGIRNFYTKGAIPSGGGGSGIAAAVDVAAAGVKALTPGTLVATGVDYVTTEDAEIYATLGGAAATANAQIRIEVDYITYD